MLRFKSGKDYKNYILANPDYMKNLQEYYKSDIIIANSIKGDDGKWYHPYIPGYETIPVLMKSTSVWGEIGPYCLKTDEGYIFENYWQFSKVYRETPNVIINQYGTVTWKYKKTNFMELNDEKEEVVNEEYWKWREKGYNAKYAIRYPLYRKGASSCVYAIPNFDKTKKYGYVEGRREIYFKKYIEYVKKHPRFWKLKKMLDSGKKLILTEIDGMKPKNADYLKEKYFDLVLEPLEYGTINATKKNFHIMVNETNMAVGHVYALTCALKSWNVDNIFDLKD